MIELIERMRSAGDSVGGIVEGVARGVPPGWGEPVFDRLEADLGKAMLSLPASKGFEIGAGFGGILLTGTLSFSGKPTLHSAGCVVDNRFPFCGKI